MLYVSFTSKRYTNDFVAVKDVRSRCRRVSRSNTNLKRNPKFSARHAPLAPAHFGSRLGEGTLYFAVNMTARCVLRGSLMNRIWRFALFGVAVGSARIFGAVPEPLAQALKTGVDEFDRRAYTETTWDVVGKNSTDGKTVVRFDPSKPYAEQYTPMQVNGKPPTAKEIKDYRKRGEDRGMWLAQQVSEEEGGNQSAEQSGIQINGKSASFDFGGAIDFGGLVGDRLSNSTSSGSGSWAGDGKISAGNADHQASSPDGLGEFANHRAHLDEPCDKNSPRRDQDGLGSSGATIPTWGHRERHPVGHFGSFGAS